MSSFGSCNFLEKNLSYFNDYCNKYEKELNKQKHLSYINNKLDVIISKIHESPSISNEKIKNTINHLKMICTANPNSLIASKILSIKKSIDSNITHNCLAQTDIEKFLPLVFVLDIDCSDHNGALTKQLLNILDQKIPCITTRAIISGTGKIDVSAETKNDPFKIFQKVNPKEWNVFTFKTQPEDEFLLLLPNTIYPDISIEERLQRLGFNTNDILDSINIDDALAGPKSHNPVFSSIYNFFSSKPTLPKHIYIDGHGGDNMSAGLELKDLNDLLAFFNHQNVQSVTISACKSGGPITANYLPSSPLSFIDKQIFKPLRSYPLILTSIGSFNVGMNPISFSDYFISMNRLLEKKQGLSTPKAQAHISKAIQIEKLDFTASPQVLLPYSRHVPGGFRTVNIKNNDKMTYIASLQNKEAALHINKSFFEMYPLHIQNSLVIPKISSTCFLSMIQGNSHHLIDELIFPKQKYFENIDKPIFSDDIPFLLESWIKLNHKKIYGVSEFSDKLNKCLFIGTIGPYKRIVIDFSNKKTSLLYEKDNQYFFQKDSEKIKISEIEYAAEVLLAFFTSRSSEKALRHASGGQEGENSLLDSMLQDSFWDRSHPPPAFLQLLKHYDESALKTLSSEEKQMLLYLSVFDKHEKLALRLLEDSQIDINRPTRRNYHLLYEATKQQNTVLVKSIIEKNADINAQEPTCSSTPVFAALTTKQPTLIDLFLNHPQLNLSHTNNLNYHTLFYADNLTLKRLLKHPNRPDINFESIKTGTLLRDAVADKDFEKIKLLIDSGIDINKGTPSPLIEAIFQRRKDIIEYLIEKGAQYNSPTQLAITKAILHSSTDIIEFFLEKIPKNEISDPLYDDVLIAAAKRSNPQLFKTLFRLGFRSSQDLKVKETSLWLQAIQNNDIELLYMLAESNLFPLSQSLPLLTELEATPLVLLLLEKGCPVNSKLAATAVNKKDEVLLRACCAKATSKDDIKLALIKALIANDEHSLNILKDTIITNQWTLEESNNDFLKKIHNKRRIPSNLRQQSNLTIYARIKEIWPTFEGKWPSIIR